MQFLILPVMLVIGTVQVFAMIDALVYLVGLPTFLAYPLAFVVGYMPIIGTAAGIVGAALVWNWSWLNAILLFVGPLVLIIIVGLVSELLGLSAPGDL